jgi:ATP-dependent helicase/nuclease subunit B
LNLWSIAPENDFLAVLAEEVRSGAMLEGGDHNLSDWTILLPTRRAARALSEIFLKQSGRNAILLPRIRPIGDIDEETLADSVATDELLPAISGAGLTHLLIDHVMGWAETRPHIALAHDISRSPAQALQLALSLQQLLNQAETEERDFSKLELAYDFELAGHRAAILDLLDVIVKEVPQRLHDRGLTTPSFRRNQLLRLEAERIARGEHKGPVVAAGSTGTNPAARELLRAIALKENGAMVLPGLDLVLDEEAWEAITPQHPQHAMKIMLAQWKVERNSVKALGSAQGPRHAILSDMMRPAEATDGWLNGKKDLPDLSGLSLVEAYDRHEEALVIALRLKQFLAEDAGKAALITPDRDLAQRVAAALRRWNIAIDDSSGEPLSLQPKGSLLVLIIRARLSGFAPADLLALVHHPLAQFGVEPGHASGLKEMLDVCCFRGTPSSLGLANLGDRINAAQQRAGNQHAHPMMKRMSEDDWAGLAAFATRISTVLGKSGSTPTPLSDHVRVLRGILADIAPQTVDEALDLLLEALEEEKVWEKPVSFGEVAPVLLHHLATTPVRPPLEPDARISTLGLLEARLVPLELVILGGLNDGAWPQLADTGPWLNRSMRDVLGLSKPERDIGITAHDFVQGLGRHKVMVTWSQRIEGKPSLPSRWILRLRAVMELRGLARDGHLSQELALLARRLNRPHAFTPLPRPAVRPDVALRPTSFSVTEIETMVRDSYAVFAKRILELEPLEDVEEGLDARLRGTLVHAAIGRWLQDAYHSDDDRNLRQLLARGEEIFRPYLAMPEVARLWWPRFERMARALIPIERELRSSLAGMRIETKGRISFAAGGVEHLLRARADRIDILGDGTLRILDYKTGELPSWPQVSAGFAPQLTLEAAIAEKGGFQNIEGAEVSDIGYVQVGGGRQAAEIAFGASKLDVLETAAAHLQSLADLLTKYQLTETAYVPRHNLFREEERSNFDHLSRRGEWELAQRSRT